MRLLLLLLFCTALRAEQGIAAYYDSKLAGRPTASGEPFNPAHLTAASYKYYKQHVTVTNPANGKRVRVWVNDRGPAKRLHRLIDLSPAAYRAIARPADLRTGTMLVQIEK